MQRFANSPEDGRIHLVAPDMRENAKTFKSQCGKTMPRNWPLVPSLGTSAAMCQQCVRKQNDSFMPKKVKK